MNAALGRNRKGGHGLNTDETRIKGIRVRSVFHPWPKTVQPIELIVGRVVGTCGGVVLVTVGLVLCARGWTGAAASALPLWAICAVVVGAGLFVAATRVAWLRFGAKSAAVWRRRAALGLPSVGLFLLLCGLTLPESPVWTKLIPWTLAIGEEALAWWWLPGGRRPTRRNGRADVQPREHVTQRLVRSKTAVGDVLRGSLRVELPAGCRLAHVHVAICPPFATTPQFAMNQSAGPKARLAVGQLFPHGARIEVKLDEPAGCPAAVWLEFKASEAV
jgi:hypothetical protein